MEPPPQPTQTEQPRTEEKSWFWEELKRLRGLGLGALMGVVRDLAVKGFPGALGQRVGEEVDHISTSLGAETIRGPLLPDGK